MRAFVIAVVLAAFVLPAAAEFEIWEYDTSGAGRGYDPSWKPDGTPVHLIVPNYCATGTQDGHDDQDGDGVMDPCENVMIDGVWKHIERVIPTIKISPVGGGDQLFIEPIEGRQNQYHIVHPPEFFCWIVPITGGIVQECEIVTVEEGPHAGEWHIDEIDTNVETNGGSPVDDSTWGKIKSFFRELFN